MLGAVQTCGGWRLGCEGDMWLLAPGRPGRLCAAGGTARLLYLCTCRFAFPAPHLTRAALCFVWRRARVTRQHFARRQAPRQQRFFAACRYWDMGRRSSNRVEGVLPRQRHQGSACGDQGTYHGAAAQCRPDADHRPRHIRHQQRGNSQVSDLRLWNAVECNVLATGNRTPDTYGIRTVITCTAVRHTIVLEQLL